MKLPKISSTGPHTHAQEELIAFENCERLRTQTVLGNGLRVNVVEAFAEVRGCRKTKVNVVGVEHLLVIFASLFSNVNANHVVVIQRINVTVRKIIENVELICLRLFAKLSSRKKKKSRVER